MHECRGMDLTTGKSPGQSSEKGARNEWMALTLTENIDMAMCIYASVGQAQDKDIWLA